MRILFLESFCGGSHQDFARGISRFSRHEIELHSLPARFWKWRMRGAALHFYREIKDVRRYDAVLATGLMSLSDLRSLWREGFPPCLLYLHEDQISYPAPRSQERDRHFGFTDITSSLAADRVVFNSHSHQEAFFSRLPGFIRGMPEYRPFWVVDEIRKKSSVIYPGCHFPGEGGTVRALPGPRKVPSEPPLIIWNHRWEFDKVPEVFFRVLDRVASSGGEFRLALLGESFQAVPKPFLRARERYSGKIVRYGYVRSRREYRKWLERGDIVVSTAIQENFGISVVEAVRFGCFPLLPKRLSYPELIPEHFHGDCLYSDEEDLESKLRECLNSSDRRIAVRRELSKAMARFAWSGVIEAYDRELERIIL